MSRVNPETLLLLRPLLVELRKIPGLTETKPGTFYVKRLPMLHFHQSPEGVVADLKCVTPAVGGFDRFDAHNETGRKKLLAETQRRCRHLQAGK